MPKASAVVLLSAGLDSTYNLYMAREQYDVRLVLTFDYSQRAATRETERARKLATRLDLPHKTLPLPWFKSFTTTALLGGRDVPIGSAIGIDDMKKSQESAKHVWVPNRNGIFLNIAAGFAEGLGAQFIIPGFNIEEAQTFPDNSEPYLKALDESLAFSTANKVKTFCFSTSMNKTQIVAAGKKLNLPFTELWPCYFNGPRWCGECESCQRYARALEANGMSFKEMSAL